MAVPMRGLSELYRDEHLVVVNKPSGLSVHRGWDGDAVNALTLTRGLVGRHVYPVHRLDRPTSGALVFALDSETAARLQDHFRAHTVGKRYLAVARGIVPEAIRIDHPVPREPEGERVDAVTNVRRLELVEERYSLIEACPETGRLHQIRRHLKHLSHPLVGDTRYGDGAINRACRERFGLARLALHALGITFAHPHRDERISVLAPPPDDLREPLARMGFSTAAWSA